MIVYTFVCTKCHRGWQLSADEATAESGEDGWVHCSCGRRSELRGRYHVLDLRKEQRMNGAELIEAERQRQLEEKHWSPEHDDEHLGGELQAAAYCYLTMGLMFERPDHPSAAPATLDMPMGGSGWPWPDGWHPDLSDPIPNLVKAGALIAAEIDRLQRMNEAHRR